MARKRISYSITTRPPVKQGKRAAKSAARPSAVQRLIADGPARRKTIIAAGAATLALAGLIAIVALQGKPDDRVAAPPAKQTDTGKPTIATKPAAPPRTARKPAPKPKPVRKPRIVRRAPPPPPPRAPADPSVAQMALADLEHGRVRKAYAHRFKVGRGDRLMQLLILEGVPRREAFAAIKVMTNVFDPRKIRVGQEIELRYGLVEFEPGRFVGLRFEIENGARIIEVRRAGKGPFEATDTKKKLTPELVRGNGRIQTSLYVAGLRAGVPPGVMIQLIQIYSFDVDFQREIRKGDAFEVMFRNFYDSKRKLVRQGDLLYAQLTLRGTRLPLYRFIPKSGRVDYFNDKGESVRKALMRTPIDGARLSSGFGRRRHPVLGYSRLHAGIDFAAPRGTPIYAAGDGAIVRRGWAGGYGRYIKIRHNSNYQTAYAHMRRFARGIGVGSRVRQGQIIGYVGTSGLSTGPHLHYEVHYKGRQINPMGLKLPTGQKLKGRDLEEFQVRRALSDNMFKRRARDLKLASRR